MDIKKFQNPDTILRPAPFWSINDKLETGETARQMTDMISVGLSGGFFHSRAGLVTDYLSKEWFDNMRAALKAAKEHDGYLWLYDEDRWPSGNAGGLIAGTKDEYRTALLDAYLLAPGVPLPRSQKDQELRMVYAIEKRSGKDLFKYRAVAVKQAGKIQKEERLVLIRRYDSKGAWWNGESYANLLNPEAMREFIRMTHDVYAKEFQEEFGKRIPGIFTDEPQIWQTDHSLPWYEGLPQVYRKWNRRNFWNDLPYMFFDGKGARHIRLLMHRAILRQFTEAYSKPIFEWCEKHGLEHTGHYNAEESFTSQIRCHCGGVMAHYRFQHAPGIDHLCRKVDGLLLTVKQVSSAARQLGRKRVLTEIFGVSRHTNTFQDFKWLGDYDLVLGATFFCPHLSWYTAKGRAKRDYPPVWNYQQTYWKELNPLNDYFTRVHYALTCGKPGAHVLLLHPIESATSDHRFGVATRTEYFQPKATPVNPPLEDLSDAQRLDEQYRKLVEATLNAGFDCDLGDEGYIQDLGSVKKGKFVVGKMAYEVVVVPPSVTWRPSTFRLLQKFVSQGGQLIFSGELPLDIEGEPAMEKWRGLASQPGVRTMSSSIENLQAAMNETVPQKFRLAGLDGKSVPQTYVHAREDGNNLILFIVNSDRIHDMHYSLVLKNGAKKVTALDPLSGTARQMESQRKGKDSEVLFTLPPCGSLLVSTGNIPQARPVKGLGLPAQTKQVALPKLWEHRRLDANVLVMDRLEASFDHGQTWTARDLEFRIREKVAKHFGTEDALWWQPWVVIRKGLFKDSTGPLTLRYKFTSDVANPRSAFLVIEDLNKGFLKVNGVPVPAKTGAWHWDRGFGKVDISRLVRKGGNVAEFSVQYNILTQVEAAYVVGDFGVELAGPYEGKIVEETKRLEFGSWVRQTYPFYSGRMVYSTPFHVRKKAKTWLRLNQPSGILFKVRVNGEEAGKILWQPYELELTPYLKDGENLLEIEVVSSLQNSWGPLHEKTGDDNQWCGPDGFEDERNIKDEFSLFNYGLLGGVELVQKA